MQSIKLWWLARKAEQVRMRLLNAKLENLTDYGLLDRIMAEEAS